MTNLINELYAYPHPDTESSRRPVVPYRPPKARARRTLKGPLLRRCKRPFLKSPSCDTENSPTAKFCIECANPLETAGGKSHRTAAASSPLQGVGTLDASLGNERKTVTVLLADIKGSMDLIQDLDPEEARAILDPALKLMMEAVQHQAHSGANFR